MNNEENFAGYISQVKVGDKLYKLRCEIVEVHPIICSRCGAPLQLHYGEGTCEHCGTHFTTKFSIEVD